MLKSAHKIMPDWSQLPIDVLECIARCLTVLMDSLKFSWVCSSWRSTALEFRPYLPPPLPGLMIPNGSDLDSQTRCFSSLSNNKLYKHTLPISRTEVVVGSFGGSRHWSLSMSTSTCTLLIPFPISASPFRPVHAILEDDLGDIGSDFVMFAALSSSNPQNTIVMAAPGKFGKLGFARLGDDSWTLIVDEHFPYDNVIFYKGAFYAVGCEDGTFVCDIEDPHPKTKLIASEPNALEVVDKRYASSLSRLILLSFK